MSAAELQHQPNDHQRAPLHAARLAELRRLVTGQVLTPDDAGYDQRRLPWNRLRVHEPALIVVAADVGDIVAAVHFASEHDLGLGVQATGHGPVLPVDGVLVDLSDLTDVLVEPDQRTAWVGAGCTWGAVLDAAQQHGLAPLLGSSTRVGAIGYTLGGGLGWLARRFGAACDSVRCFEVVTPGGRLVRASAEENRDLFTALRGGGGGAFGVVTGMEIDLVPVTTVYAGDLLYPAAAAATVIDRYARWVHDAPPELTSGVVLMNFPPVPDVPEELRGRSYTIVRGCWSGDLGEGRRFLDAFRDAMPPLMDLWRDLPFTECDAISNDPVDPLPSTSTGGWLSTLDAGVGQLLATATFPAQDVPKLLFTEIRHVGGAVAKGDRSTSALGHRECDFAFHLIGVPGEHSAEAITAHQQDVRAALGDAVTGPYLNFVEHDERRACSSDAVEPSLRSTLAALQRRLDPAGSLRYGVDHSNRPAPTTEVI